MTVSIYENMKLVQLEPDGESYFAIPLEKKGTDPADAGQLMAVDTGWNLAFITEYAVDEMVSIEDIPPLNRFITIRLPYTPGMIEASAFHLLKEVVNRPVSNEEWNESEPKKKFLLLVLNSLYKNFCRGLYQAVAMRPAPEEMLYVEHDFIAHGVQAMWAQSGMEDDDEELTG